MLDGNIAQYAYVVADLDAAIGHWTESIGAGPFFVRRHLDLPVEHRGKQSVFDISVALGQAGPIQIELVQVHSATQNCFTEMYPQGGGGLHHVALFTPDLDSAIRSFENKGGELATRGVFGSTPFAFMDARRQLGFFVELYQDSAELRGIYALVADAAAGWDRITQTRPL
ncbi:MAG: VOC family protein [Rhodocyclaceae bacterium]|nr:VOC family protein [Rhodocyclaceae bacterium]